MKLSPDVPWLRDENAQALCIALETAGFQALFVGGCVRNAVMGEPASDIDIASDAHPEQLRAVCADAGFRAIPTGIEHGTITVVIKGVPYEVTTFRKDVETDGRRAVVAFSTDVVDDARRRDFTMNALYARRDGTIIDPLKGYADAIARKVVFIEDPGARIREDYLRILRFFRFSAWYADSSNGFDPEALNAVAQNLEGLEQLSAERIGAELLKLLGAPDPAPAVAAMDAVGVLPQILPGASTMWLGPVIFAEEGLGLAPNPIRRLAALGGVETVDRLRLSNAQARQISLLQDRMVSGAGAKELGYAHGFERACDILALRSAVQEVPPDPQDKARALAGSKLVFPVTAKDLMPELAGPALGAKLKELEALWLASDFSLSKEQLLR